LGQRFPASDIPEPARRLYRKNTLRYIPDVEPDPVRIVGPEGPRDRRELDLTYSGLRAVPRVHCRYLRNMGVAGSMSISFVVEGELAGLLACHSVEPVAVGWSRRELCRQVGQIVADRLAGLRATRRERRIRELDDLEEEVDDTSGGYEELLEQIGHHRDRWLQGLNASGMHLCLRDRTLWLTDEETRRAGGELLDWIESELVEHSRVAVDSIVEEIDAEWDRPAVAGFLAVRLGETASSYAVWFRPEERRTVEWAGDPRRPASLDDGEERIDPRQSFETWTQEVAGRCAPWSETDRAVADACRKLFSRLTLETQYAQLQTLNEQLEVINERNRELVERLDQVARTDDLTGLPNRRELNRRVREEVDRAERYQSALSFILLDIDHFKSINDERGHRAGDRVLEEVGSLLDGETRGPDLPARYGGEEFAVLLPNTELDEAVELAERLLEALRSHRFELDDDSISVTCSAGVSSLRAGDDAEALIGRADEAMYRAKDAGRDRVESEEVER
ncbi:MAG: diguanylate cyclase, partial [Bradymonadaceae bacterium]